MPGYDKQIVVDAVRAELERTTDGEDARYDKKLHAWQQERAATEDARSKIRTLHDDLTIALAAGDWEAVQKAGKQMDDGYRGPAQLVVMEAAIPQRVRSVRERALQRVIDILDSTQQTTVTVADLRSFGVLDYVRNSNNAC